MSGIRLVHVPYKSSTQAIVDVLAGRVDSQFGILTTNHQNIREGKLNALGVTTLERVAEFPDIPTIAEQGLPGYEASLWLGVVAPARLPAPVLARLSGEMDAILRDPQIRGSLFSQAIVTQAKAPEAFARHIGEDAEKWRKLAQAAGLAIEAGR
jgi:tripartite-type tricarboxylate transporter receptor subunit TctC